MQVDILIFDGFDELDAVGPYEVLAQAGRSGADLTVRLVTLRPTEQVTAAHGLRVASDGILDGGADLVVVAGGGWGARSDVGAWGEAQRGDLPERLAGLHASGVPLAAVCTGGMLLARAGVLRDRPAVTHRSARGDLVEAGAIWTDERVVDEGDVMTSGGVTSGLDLALWIVERYFGGDVARRVEEHIEYRRLGRVRRSTR